MTTGSAQLEQVAQTAEQQALVRRFAEMVTSLPEIPQDGGLGILADIFNAQTLEDLDRTWSDRGEDWAEGRELVFESLAAGESDFASGIGYFLLVTAVEVATGEEVKFTTGSVNVMGQLVMAHHLGQLPFVGTIVRNERATRNGFKPQHIVVSANQAAAARLA